MKIASLSDLLHLDVPGCVTDADADEVVQLALDHAAPQQRLYFGLPYFTAPRPLLIGGLMTEKNTLLRAPLLFTWIEDNYIREPRAEVFGMTTEGERPVMFLRDFDMDRPREIWLRCGDPLRWRRLDAVTRHDAVLTGDDGALTALAYTAPPEVRTFVDALRADVAAGRTLKAALRARRKATAPALMALADGWRIIMTQQR